MTALLILLAAAAFIAGYAFALWRVRCAVRHIKMLDALLQHLCALAFVHQHAPIWRAWMSVMGSYRVEMVPERRDWSEGD